MSRRHVQIRPALIAGIAALLLSAAVYAAALSWYEITTDRRHDLTELVTARGIELLILGWCLWVGASIGSFLNVVAWRLPRGIGINGRSICPRCHVRLLARDNLPVFGWLARGGRCRVCRLPISPRYPIVEAIVGISIAAVAAGELFQLSLPFGDLSRRARSLWNVPFRWPTFAIMTYHVLALSTAWASGLIRLDRHPLPRQLVTFAITTTVIPMLLWPTLMVVPWQVSVASTWRPDGLYIDSLIRVITALVAASFCARSLTRSLCPAADPKLDPLGRDTAALIDLTIMLAVPILVVGWQASPALLVTASIVAIGLRRRLAWSDPLGRFAIAIPAALTLQLALWRTLQQSWWWPSAGTEPWVILAWAAAAMLVPLWLKDRPAESP